MLESLAQIVDGGKRLKGVAYVLFDGDPKFVTACELRFDELTAVFRAVEEDDTLDVSIGRLVVNNDEALVDVSSSLPWAACIGLDLQWLWRLTNQQGYSDGVRLQFRTGEKPSILELIVAASAIRIFAAEEVV